MEPFLRKDLMTGTCMNFAKLFETAISDPAKNQNIFRRFQLQKTLQEGVSFPVLYSLLNLTFFFP